MSYKDKVISLDDALGLIKSGTHVATGLGPGEAQDFFKNIHKIADRVDKVYITNFLPTVHGDYLHEEYKDKFEVESLFFTKPVRDGFHNGNISYVPQHLSLSGVNRLANSQPDIFVAIGSMPDEHGYISLSLSNAYERKMMDASDMVMIEINENYPRTFGDVEIHYSDVDHLIISESKPPIIPEGTPNEKDLQIGKHIAELINDGDCIQLGIGGIPDAVAKCLEDKKDLGVHTEMFTTGIMKLAKKGVVTGKKKTLHKGKIVCTFAQGTEELYEFIDNNPSVLVYDANYVNNPDIIRQNDNMVSINTTLEVDLAGQCASESIGSRQFSGTGGQTDTATGAQKAKNGKSFIALYSTANVRQPGSDERVEISTIVPTLKPGSMVTLSRNDVDNVVTEYGVAKLRGASMRERAERLIAIAHPKYREELTRQAKELNYL